jgi:hypothetical protein
MPVLFIGLEECLIVRGNPPQKNPGSVLMAAGISGHIWSLEDLVCDNGA